MQKNTSRGFLFCVATKNLRRLARSGDGVFVEYGIVLKYCRRQISGAPLHGFRPDVNRGGVHSGVWGGCVFFWKFDDAVTKNQRERQ